MHLNKLYFILFLVFNIIIIAPLFAQNKADSSLIKWYNFDEAEALNTKSPKPLLIDIYTDWCGWCTKMMKTTYANQQIADYINLNFYPIKFDAETSQKITFNNKTYIKTGTEKRAPNQLAIELIGEKLSYPSTIFVDKTGKRSLISGYLDYNQILPLLIYFAEEINKTTNFDEFQKNFNDVYINRDTTAVKSFKDNVNWIPMQDALTKSKTTPKKIYLDIYNDWKTSCNMMRVATYNNPVIADYLNKNFYPVRFNCISKDTINIGGQIFINENKDHPFHQMAVAMLDGKMAFPALLIFDENFKLIYKEQVYFTAERIEPILHFFSEEKFKDTKWEDFLKNFKPEIKKNGSSPK
ncbi:MAG: DUF255 domain-containing protein [Bacteroidetes bacterium]|nr:DUF255 domain-containing protein [Bacteroidota bacterium]